jgi:hypothetical protein
MVAVAVALYGDKYLPMLLSFLESWGRLFPPIYLAIGDVSEQVVEDIAATFPSVELVPAALSFSKDEQVRISQKMRLWRLLANHPKLQEHEFTIFADADTVLVRDISDFCRGDIVVTMRGAESQFILNTGIVGLSREALLAEFVQDWSEANEKIIGDPALLEKATSPKEIYGGGDQMALIQMLGLARGVVSFSYKGLNGRAVDCEIFNACENTIDPAKASVYHLKASLHKFLLERRPLLGVRRLEDSIVQLRAAIEDNRTAICRMRSLGIPRARVEKLYSFRLPRGIRSDLSLPAVLMAFHRTNALTRRAARSVLSSVKLG